MMQLRGLLLFSCVHLGLGDLRMASQPRRGFKVRHMSRRRQIKFNTSHAVYMEPSDFGYIKLMRQREKAYDNFLRSNIDNEQDRRNFDYEDGKDHLPFRSYEGFSTDVHISTETKIPAEFPGTNITAAPGDPVLVPLRWNNPHSAELEVNVWIMKNKYVVPILKPTCSGEGYQDNAFSFTVPKDFNNLGAKVPSFAGCKKVGDCVLQIYAHSVESRTYSMGSPFIVTGTVTRATAANENQIQAAGVDKAYDMTRLSDLCLSRSDPAANYQQSIPRHARYVSDQFNHAYQNSDYSPYSGQQPWAISKNMQASCILKMVPGNRGELGKRALQKDNPKGFRLQRQLDRKAKKLVRQYEELANSLINLIGGKMKNSDVIGPAANAKGENKLQSTEECFRCEETGSTTARRLETPTYIPSFQIPPALLTAVQTLIGDEYKSLISPTGLVGIYVAALADINEEFKKAEKVNITYQGPMIKPYLATMADLTNFKKKDENGRPDKGEYAARAAYKAHGVKPWAIECVAYISPTECEPKVLPDTPPTPMAATLAKDFGLGTDFTLPALTLNNGSFNSKVTSIGEVTPEDMHGVMVDANCDDPEAPGVDTMTCVLPTEQLFALPEDIEAEALGLPQPYSNANLGMVAAGAHRPHAALTAAGALSSFYLLTCL